MKIFFKKHFTDRRGQSLMELLIGMAVGGILIAGTAAIISSSLQANGQVINIQIQAQLGEELLNNVKSWAQGNWNALLALATSTANNYYLNTASSPFTILPATSSSGSSSTYSYTRSITVTSTTSIASGTNTNFPMLFSGTYSWLEPVSDGGRIQNLVTAPNGGQEPADLIFSSNSSCSSPLNFETESYTSSTGAIADWVNVPSLSAGSVIYACYGATSITTDQSHPSATWNSNYAAVYHLSNGTTLNTNDSTANGHNAGVVGSPGATTGAIGGGINFSNGSYLTPSSISLASGVYTLSAWFKTPLPTAPDGYETLFRGSLDHPILVQNSGELLGVYDNTGPTGFHSSGFVVTSLSSGWHYLTAVTAGSNLNFYIDGSYVGVSNFKSSNDIEVIGNYAGDGNQQWGYADEVRIANIAQVSSWILTEYNNQNSPSTFYTVGSEVSNGGGSSTSSTYSYTRSITVTSTTSIASGTNTNFPMLFSGTYSWLEPVSNGGRIQHLVTAPNGGQEPADLVFSSTSSCSSPLNFETESYTSSTGAIADWVNVPSLSAGSVIYACYGATSITTDQSHPSATWNSNYGAVWHFPTSLGLNDSTANGNTLANAGAVAAAGQIGGAASISASTQMSATNSASINVSASNFTISTWIKTTSTASYAAIYEKSNGGGLGDYSLFMNAGVLTYYRLANDGGGGLSGTHILNDGNWHYVVWSRSGNNNFFYVDSVFDTSVSDPTIATTTGPLSLGQNLSGGGANHYSGQYDEFRILNVALTPSWILTEYNNQNSPSTFYSVGSETANSTGGSTSSSVEFVTNNGVVFQRSFFVSDVYRDASGNVTTTASGNFDDPSTKLITATVSVASSTIPPTIYSMYITRNLANYFGQQTWSGGAGATQAKNFVSSTYAAATSTGITPQGGFKITIVSVSSTYNYNSPITVTSTTSIASGTNSNFPMLFSGTYSWLAASSSAGKIQNLTTAPNGGQEPADLIFTSAASCTTSTALNFETESYTSSTGAIVDWINVPSLSAGSVIYACYGSTSVTTDQSHPSSTWNSNYLAVYHFPTIQSTSTLQINDSTVYGNNGSTVSGAPVITMGQIGGGGSFSSSDEVTGSGNAYTSGSSQSFGAWLYWKDTSTVAVPFYNGNGASDGYGFVIANGACGTGDYLGVLVGAVSCDAAASTYVLPTNTWVYVVATENYPTWTLYANGIQVAQNNNGSFRSPTNAPQLGGGYHGNMDEVWLENIPVSQSWVMTQYNNQASPSTFYTVGSSNALGGSTGTSTLDSAPYDTGLSSGAELNSLIWQGTLPVSTSVKFQIAVSNSSNGPWTFVGPDGTASTYFSGNPGTPINLVSTTNGYTLFNGYRYFSYRATLNDIGASSSPIVSGVTVDWSP